MKLNSIDVLFYGINSNPLKTINSKPYIKCGHKWTSHLTQLLYYFIELNDRIICESLPKTSNSTFNCVNLLVVFNTFQYIRPQDRQMDLKFKQTFKALIDLSDEEKMHLFYIKIFIYNLVLLLLKYWSKCSQRLKCLQSDALSDGMFFSLVSEFLNIGCDLPMVWNLRSITVRLL